MGVIDLLLIAGGYAGQSSLFSPTFLWISFLYYTIVSYKVCSSLRCHEDRYLHDLRLRMDWTPHFEMICVVEVRS